MKKETFEAVSQLEDKYFKLVWYARKTDQDRYNPACEKGIKEAEFLYPSDIDDLASDFGQWHHGFNSGVLAATRFFIEAESSNVKNAADEFPDLDT